MRVVNEIFPTVVLAVRDCADFFELYLESLTKLLNENFDYFEIIVVDDASIDNTVPLIEAKQDHLPNITLFCLPKTYGHAIATVAGIDHAIGDVVIVLDARRDQPQVVLALIEEAMRGADIVYALPRDRVENIGIYNRVTTAFLGGLARYNRIDLPAAMSSAMLFSRSVLNFILKAGDRDRILTVAPALSGYRYATVVYERSNPWAGKGRWMLWRDAVAAAVNLTFAISPRPLRFITLFSLAIGAITIFYSGYVLIYWLLIDDIARGWTSLSLQVSGLFFLISLVLAVMAEYLQQVLDSTGRRPLYFVARQNVSNVMDYAQSSNVIANSERDEKELPDTLQEIE